MEYKEHAIGGTSEKESIAIKAGSRRWRNKEGTHTLAHTNDSLLVELGEKSPNSEAQLKETPAS